MQNEPQTFEQQLAQRLMGQQNVEKTHTDKLLARSEVAEIQGIMKSEDLTRSQLLNMIYLLSSAEAKLANYGDRDRYLLGKLLTWIRDFVSVCEILYDYKAIYDKATDTSQVFKNTKKMMEISRKHMMHDIKFMVDIFLYLSRSTLSLGMAAFETLSTQRFEYAYPQWESVQQQDNTSPFGKIKLR